MSYTIMEKCNGCGAWGQNCPDKAISVGKKKPHRREAGKS